ncbi:MAG TPA: UbiD family decarboxylase [Thermoanaerobacterales bacterium]|nr:UbiD family decarboxylase [Thermoanaerobacterales bacterium]
MPEIYDLRHFINKVKELAPEELVEINERVYPANYEVNTFLDIFKDKGKFPMILFNNVEKLNGGKFEGRLITSADPGSYRRAAIAFGLELDKTSSKDVIEELGKRAQVAVKPMIISEKEAPIKEVVRTGKDADVGELPLLMHFAEDAKPGWFTPIVAFKHPDTGRYNLAYHRTLYHGPQRVTIKISPEHELHAGQYYNRAQELNQPLPFACILGHHPGFYQGAAIRTPIAMDEYEQVGGVLGQPLRLTASTTWGDKFLIPADAEIVVEGEMWPGERDNEGMFGEWPRYYGCQTRQPVGRITAINMRKDAIFQAIWTSYHMLEDIAHSVGLQAWLKSKYPRVIAASSLFHTWAIISMKKKAEGEPLRVANMALAYGEHVKYVIVVDEDINPFDLREVYWAISMRVQPDDRVQILKNVKSNRNDPSTVHPMKGSVMIIDATEPVDRPFEKVVSVPAETKERLKANWDKYVSKEIFDKVPVRDRWTY